MLRTEQAKFNFHSDIFIIIYSGKAEEWSELEKAFELVIIITVIIFVDNFIYRKNGTLNFKTKKRAPHTSFIFISAE